LVNIITLLTKDDEVRLAQTIEEGREAKAELDASETDKKIKLTPSRSCPEAFRTPG